MPSSTYVVAQLRASAIRFTTAANGARRWSHRSDVHIDVLLPCDHAGSYDGRQLAEAAKSGSQAQVLFTSGYTENAIVHTASTLAFCCWRSLTARPTWRG